jgi:3-deoxy-D-manno-octulosonic-acid transferase
MYGIYSLFLTVAALLSAPYWLIRGIRQRKYLGTVSQRISMQLPSGPFAEKPLWFHAVSVGEVLAAKVLFTALCLERPGLPVVVSTVTLTGQALARKEIPAALSHFYFPFDWMFCVRRFLRRINPCGVVIFDTEMWPNFLRACETRGIPTIIANARISDNSYPRYLRVRFLTRSMLKKIRAIGAQTREDRERFLRLGGREDQVQVTGNLKYDFEPPDLDSKKDLLQLIRCRLALTPETPIVVVGSSMKGEEAIFLEAYLRVLSSLPRTRLIIAPRHPERFEEVAELLRRSGADFLRRSNLRDSKGGEAKILLLDSVGELRSVYSLADVAVIGGSFLPFGGHNPLEPAAFGKAIVFGPEMGNFKEVARLFLRDQAALQCSRAELALAVIRLLSDIDVRRSLGERALRTLKENQGAVHNTLRIVLRELQ